MKVFNLGFSFLCVLSLFIGTSSVSYGVEPVTLKSLLDKSRAALESTSPEINKSPDNVPVSAIKSSILKEVKVVGNKHVSSAEILSHIPYRKGDTINSIKVNRVVKNVRSLNVFADVSSDLKETPDGSLLTITVVENPVISSITFSGNTVFPTSELMGLLKSKVGKILNYKTIRSDMAAIQLYYQEKGYTQSRVFDVEFPETDQAPLSFNISEGVIDEIIVTGNTKTKDYVIIRELVTKPGDVMNQETLKEDLRRVFNLNYFTNLEPHFLPSVTPNHYVMEVEVTEKPSNAQFTIGGAYSPTTKFSLFSDLYWDNLFGTGQLVMLRGQFGKATSAQFKYFHPWMFGERKSFTFKTWALDGEVAANPVQTDGTGLQDQRSKGVEFGIGWPISYELNTTHFWKSDYVTLTDSDTLTDSGERKHYQKHSYTFGVQYDTRDVRFNPTKGRYDTYSVEQGIGFNRDALSFTKFDATWRYFLPTFKKQTLATRLSVGALTGPILSDDPDFFSQEVYWVGGSNTVRGYNDDDPFSTGSRRVITSLEYRFLFTDIFSFIMFLDSGLATDSGHEAISPTRWQTGKGLGVRILIPGLGPLRLDYGFSQGGNPVFHFNIGHTF